MAVFRLGLFTLLLWLVAGVHFPAFAAPTNVQFCNQYPHTVRFAAAWKQGGTMRSRGWWPVATRHCTSVSVPANSFFWRAEMRYDNGSSTVTGAWGDRGHRSFCTSEAAFAIGHADGPCLAPSSRKGYLNSFIRDGGSPIYEKVTLEADTSENQSFGHGHGQNVVRMPLSP
jgi:uncharacterized membrane protein